MLNFGVLGALSSLRDTLGFWCVDGREALAFSGRFRPYGTRLAFGWGRNLKCTNNTLTVSVSKLSCSFGIRKGAPSGLPFGAPGAYRAGCSFGIRKGGSRAAVPLGGARCASEFARAPQGGFPFGIRSLLL
ncbi:hypothetical protein [Paenibacillus agricola]|uniref:Uncharacterized protein n=1 Tax=Paenibacillus agricola TaxID=2716264 RepID=A0ABX0J8C7_9BACL|nr:hypothetical protein [Paenibacillus agricola]NHN30015.1 hypothetical protein [Paenibacillus agricola]